MTGSAQASSNPTTTPAAKDQSTVTANGKDLKKQAAQLEEDDEFEDFPVEDWGEEETQLSNGNQHLWEESWDDDDTNEEFSKQLKDELRKIEGTKKA